MSKLRSIAELRAFDGILNIDTLETEAEFYGEGGQRNWRILRKSLALRRSKRWIGRKRGVWKKIDDERGKQKCMIRKGKKREEEGVGEERRNTKKVD